MSKVDAPLACYQNSVVSLLQAIVVACVEIDLASPTNVSVAGVGKAHSSAADGDAAGASQEKEPFDALGPSEVEASEAQ